MSPTPPTLDNHEEALNMLALLCGSLIRTLAKHDLMTPADVEALIGSLEGAAEKVANPLITNLTDQVRWAAEWKKDPKP